MKTYQVELKRVSYVTVSVDADNGDQAEEIAWKELERYEHENGDADWSLESISEVDDENLEIAIDDISHINEQLMIDVEGKA